MAEFTHSFKTAKATLEIDWSQGSLFLVETSKDGVETKFDLAEVLNNFNGKTIGFNITEKNPAEPVDDLADYKLDTSDDFFSEE